MTAAKSHKTVFESSSYREFLALRLDKKLAGHGVKSRLAQAMRCELSYLSQILSGKAEMSLEQAHEAGRFFGLSDHEHEYFILLHQRDRAGSASLRQYFNQKIHVALATNHSLKDRFSIHSNPPGTLADVHLSRYYSAWQFAAVHVATSIRPEVTSQEIATIVGISKPLATETLEQLCSFGLVKRLANGRYSLGSSNLHIDKNSPFCNQHHTNWRLRGMSTMRLFRQEDLFYSTVMTCAEKDIYQIKEEIVRAIEAIRAIVRQSKEETLAVFNIDFFGLRE